MRAPGALYGIGVAPDHALALSLSLSLSLCLSLSLSLSLLIWAPLMAAWPLVLFVDNEAAKGADPVAPRICREIASLESQHRVRYSHVPTASNIADAPSRGGFSLLSESGASNP